ncbi:MAG TPA: ABC transporter permease [Candidatus Polarisedimenticolia bacterium]|nr:ABC transporter permease [Candidatus Polarisedimenticolia bacterium]
MHKLLMVIRREYLERIRKRSFWLGTLLLPLLMVGLVVVQLLLADVETGKQRKVALVDGTGRLAATFMSKLGEEKNKDGASSYSVEVVPVKGSVEETRGALEPRILSGDLYGVITAGDDVDATSNFRFYARSVGNVFALKALQRALRESVVGLRLEKSHLDVGAEELKKLLAPVEMESFEVKEQGQAKKRGFDEAYFGTFAFVMVLYMALLLYGVAVMRGILEEKSNRIMEVLLGSLTPDELMTGKILGIGLVGLTQMAIYIASVALLRLYVGVAALQAGWTGALDTISPSKMAYFCIFFLLGYFLYTSMFAAVGAVCNSEQEAQNLQSPLVMCLVVPMVMTFFFVANPDSPAAVVASLIPLFAPMVMFMRIMILTPPFWQIALSILLLIVTIYFFFRGVGRIFRIGVLMYGKRPTVPEILKWARG